MANIIDRIRTVDAVGYALDVPNDLREHCRATSDDDGELYRYLLAAVDAFESESGLAILNQTWQIHLDNWFDTLEIKPAPVQSVTVTYYDENGDEQTLAGTEYIDTPALRLVEFTGSKPSLHDRLAPVVVTAVCGYGSGPDAVPDKIKHALRVYVAHLYANREAVTEGNNRVIELSYRHLLNASVVDWI